MNVIDFAIVHHANQYLITNGYENREGLDDVVGRRDGETGYRKILELHQKYGVPFNLHLSSTVLEAILWHRPEFLTNIRILGQQGLLDVIGSSYGQNIMRFFGYEHNFRQVNECLRLRGEHLGVELINQKVFWPPERLWDTKRLAPVLTDERLQNRGYKYVLIDDRLFYPAKSGSPSRKAFDQGLERRLDDFYPCLIVGGNGLTALPISSLLRQNIPPRAEAYLNKVTELFHWLAGKSPEAGCRLIAIYADDLEKTAGCCGWDEAGPAQYEFLLRWLADNPWVRPVKLNEWGLAHCDSCRKTVEVGSYLEMSQYFGAGEDYEKWYRDPKWDKYRNYFSWSEEKVTGAQTKGADPALLETAWKHLLASAWETAWHTPAYGVHGNPSSAIEPSPWVRAVASHSRHAAVIAEAAWWMAHKDGAAHARLEDIDNDGHEELILANDKLFAVFSPLCGGRLVYLFSIGGREGKMVIGNPSDDWNWQEELNKYMKIPANHPGALSDAEHEDDRYDAAVVVNGEEARAVLVNRQPGSPAFGLEKSMRLARGAEELEVTYRLPRNLMELSLECGLSPDYLHLLRFGGSSLKEHAGPGSRGYSNNDVSVWVRLEDPAESVFDRPDNPRQFGHGYALSVRATGNPFRIWIGAGNRQGRT